MNERFTEALDGQHAANRDLVEQYYAEARRMQSREFARLMRKLVTLPTRLLNRRSSAARTATA